MHIKVYDLSLSQKVVFYGDRVRSFHSISRTYVIGVLPTYSWWMDELYHHSLSIKGQSLQLLVGCIMWIFCFSLSLNAQFLTPTMLSRK